MNISAIGQADDSCLLSSSVHSLGNLVNLTLDFCRKYHVELVPEKTKLIAFFPPSQSLSVYYSKIASNIMINSTRIEFSSEAEHVGIIRSVNGNLPNILSCFTAHTNAVRAVLPARLGRGHRANPAASLKIEKIYSTSVLLSGLTTGLSSLVLSKAEITCLSTHYKTCLEGLMKLYPRTPAPVVAFLSSSLPASALLHIDQLALFGILISRQDDSPLKRLAYSTLSSSPIPPKSWFKQISDLSQQYSLPSPLTLLTSPPTKDY